MNNEKIEARFKFLPEDFIVEEIQEKGICKISSSKENLFSSSLDLTGLNLEDRRAFLTCELEKFDLDHFSVFEELSKSLKKRFHELGYAGTKDKVAWTCQRISIYNPSIERLKEFSYKAIKLKNFKWSKHKIDLGDLKGNRFQIVLRDVGKEVIKISNKIRHLDNSPNFFGPQRFGSLRNDNLRIGKLLLKKKFEQAIWEFLLGYGKEDIEIIKAKKRLKDEKDILKAKDYFPKILKLELIILNYLSKFPKDWIGALNSIDEKILLLIGQSVQSKIFNDILQMSIENNLKMNGQKLILPGYQTKFSQGRLGSIEREVLRMHNLELEDFNTKEIPALKFKGSFRKAYFQVKNVNLIIEDDEIFNGSKKIKLSFELESGAYATTLLEQFFILN
jgi:tRNA pseudouridine13 synthase